VYFSSSVRRSAADTARIATIFDVRYAGAFLFLLSSSIAAARSWIYECLSFFHFC
jgi:hypothetical protein